MKKILIGVTLAFLLVACKSKDTNTNPPVVERSTGGTTSGTGTGTTTAGTGTGGGVVGTGSGNFGVNPLTDPNNVLSKRIIYFDYDQDAVRPDYVLIVQAHARYLTENPGRSIRLEGHADERGSREYNMALGQRRSEAVRRAASALGVSASRMETISFGEDKPRATGQDEASWAQNRRVEIVYDGE